MESNYSKRLISEMLYSIKEQRNEINLQKDIERLDNSYFYLLNSFSQY